MFDIEDRYADARDMALAVAKLEGLGHPQLGMREITGPASAAKAAMDRFRRDHPQENLPWGYMPDLG